MLRSCFGLSLRTGTTIIAIANAIASIFYIIYNVWEYSRNYGYSGMNYAIQSIYNDEVFFNYIASMFMLAGFTLLFVNLGLRQATLKNETHKIYLWLLVTYVQLGIVLTIEIDTTLRYTWVVFDAIKIIIGFTFIDAILVYQILIVHSFYYDEKLIQETNYSTLRSELTTQVEEEHPEEFQNVEL